ncbi:hypothetical protein L1887_03762 [Cichorium endivia]|nr:hypothetical protein L1887_03762 [Cichorium endivia]
MLKYSGKTKISPQKLENPLPFLSPLRAHRDYLAIATNAKTLPPVPSRLETLQLLIVHLFCGTARSADAR